jgi:hypothetical protein
MAPGDDLTSGEQRLVAYAQWYLDRGFTYEEVQERMESNRNLSWATARQMELAMTTAGYNLAAFEAERTNIGESLGFAFERAGAQAPELVGVRMLWYYTNAAGQELVGSTVVNVQPGDTMDTVVERFERWLTSQQGMAAYAESGPINLQMVEPASMFAGGYEGGVSL